MLYKLSKHYIYIYFLIYVCDLSVLKYVLKYTTKIIDLYVCNTWVFVFCEQV